MPYEAGSSARRKSRRSAGTEDVSFLGCLGALGALTLWALGSFIVVQWAPSEIGRRFGWPYVAVYYLLLVLGLAVVRVWQYHRRGLTIREGVRADRAQERHLRELRQSARQAAAALPWLTDKRRHPTDWPGVVITPAPEAPGYFRGGYDVILDAAGDRKIQVISQVKRLTRLPLATAKQLIDDGTPLVVLRVPDVVMAYAAKSVLESVGATVSVTGPAESAG